MDVRIINSMTTAIAILVCGKLNLNTGKANKFEFDALEDEGECHMTLFSGDVGDVAQEYMVVIGAGAAWPVSDPSHEREGVRFKHDQSNRDIRGSWLRHKDYSNTRDGLDALKRDLITIRGVETTKVTVAVLK